MLLAKKLQHHLPFHMLLQQVSNNHFKVKLICHIWYTSWMLMWFILYLKLQTYLS